MNKKLRIGLFSLVGICALLVCAFATYAIVNKKPRLPQPLGIAVESTLALQYEKNQRFPLVKPLFYTPDPPKPVHAQAAIIIDAANGTILFEKNADEHIPPASLTKLVVMYIVFQEAASGRVKLTDTVPLPPESWAVNAPPMSSLMFLGENQRVTLEELLLGLAIASGNDAAIAVAHYISGSVPAFVERMNEEMQKLGLTVTRFVEPSGYDENNTTTAREFSAFCREYVSKYPESLERFHSARKISYPLAHNMPAGLEHTYAPYIQNATNRLLEELDGCDGLKTGFIFESGYNIAVTAERGASRFISVTLGGPGKGAVQGNYYRVADGKNLFEWAFSDFYTTELNARTSVPIQVWQGTQNSVNLTEYAPKKLTIPKKLIQGQTEVVCTLDIPISLTAPVEVGKIYGKALYTVADVIIAEIPLVADRTIREANTVKKVVDKAAQRINER